MELTDLLPWNWTPAESRQNAESLRTWIASAVALARAEVDHGADRDRLEKHFAALSQEDAQRLCGSITTTPADIWSPLEALRRAHGEPAANAREIYTGLTSVQRQIETAVRRRRLWMAGMTALKVAAYAGPVVGAYLIGTYFRFYNNVYWDSDTITSPAGTYTYLSGGYDIPEPTRARFFREFSRSYFGRANSFAAQFVRTRQANPSAGRSDSPDSERQDDARLDVVKVRLIFRNPRGAEPLLVSSVEASATYRQEAFDWSRVDVTTDLDVTVSRMYGPDAIQLADRGVGPAANVQYSVLAGGLTMNAQHFDYILNEPRHVFLEDVSGNVVALSTDDADRTKLASPIFWNPSDKPAASGDARRTGAFTIAGNILRCSNGQQFEQITSVERLSQLTKTVQGGPATVNVSFESLRGQKASKSIAAALPTGIVFAQGADRIEQSNPCVPPPPPPPPPPVPPPPLTSALPELLDRLAGPASTLKGVDLIKAAATLDLSGVPDGGVVAQIASPDEILNPAGFLMLDLTIRHAGNGHVGLAINVNRLALRALEVQLLVPDDMSFMPMSDTKVGHFRQAQTASQSARPR